ncbi:hypothetical protein [Rubrimonas cliftonensis]|uniref:DUF5681 domain-containing protein n=1 Tax=Rubrimonas cliftonensis TaxID=89524 RepID=A0A1H4F3E0_9RHOB|nr:hypothetical protein [Rubrimonas cliftonensis]SEA91002.1 hypothetical protein SAMN05444370_11762 [Rubrimonas cliftonensis]
MNPPDRNNGETTAPGGRDAQGRFAPGSANRGRPKGARHRTTLAIEAMIGDEAEALARTAIRLALAGDGPLLRALLDRLAPPPKDRAASFTLPPLRSLADAQHASGAILRAASRGEITPADARALAEIVAAFTRAGEALELEARIAELEARVRQR